MTELIEIAHKSSPSVDVAIARIRQARATLDTDDAARFPTFTFNASSIRGGSRKVDPEEVRVPLTTTRSRTIDASWEIDLFGGQRRAVEASQALLEASEADLRSARVSLAAEVANTYASRRHCEAMLLVAEEDLASRTETHRLTLQKLDAGFSAPADSDRTDASVAEAESNLKSQAASCATLLNQLVALTGLTYGGLEHKLASKPANLPRPPTGRLDAVPAHAIAQRPDVASAERKLAEASANIGVAEAARLPSLKLIGSIGINQVRGSTNSITTHPWSFGPSISLPIFDGGKAAAAVRYADGVYQEALATYQANVRNAVLEVENALVRVETTARRMRDIERANLGYNRFFDATEVQYREGAASLLALEDARRILLASQQALLAEQLEQAQAWIALYKAVGGGWRIENLAVAAPDMAAPTAILLVK